MHLWPNLLGVLYPMPLGGRIASVIRHFCHPKTASPMTRRDQSWLSATFAIQRQSCSIAREDRYGHLHPSSETSVSFDRDYFSLSTHQLEASEPVDSWRPIMVIRHLCHPEMASLMTRTYTSRLSAPLLFRDNQVRWHARPNVVICSLCRRLNVYRPRLL